MRVAGLVAVSAWLGLFTLDLGCVLPPRVEWCREPLTDFSGVTDVQVRARADSPVSVIVTATGTNLGDCIEVTSTMSVPGTGSDTTRVFVRATVEAGVLSSRPVYHYDGPPGLPFGGSVVVTTLGRTVEAPIEIPGVDTPVDAGGD